MLYELNKVNINIYIKEMFVMGYPKKHRGRRKIGSKKEEREKEIKENNKI